MKYRVKREEYFSSTRKKLAVQYFPQCKWWFFPWCDIKYYVHPQALRSVSFDTPQEAYDFLYRFNPKYKQESDPK